MYDNLKENQFFKNEVSKRKLSFKNYLGKKLISNIWNENRITLLAKIIIKILIIKSIIIKNMNI